MNFSCLFPDFDPKNPRSSPESEYGAAPGYHASQQLAAQVYEATGHRLATLPQAVAECPGYD